ncbi:hypothetical protein LPW11_00955 [Geomonas sp. RF6]|uniref:hypothetical protein n=1 Tax=Geomonas sp. RF6 TaxID=2897342 RepID=UPI001E34FA9A|nr:hypothetical protein [Geomonas sp. RF6]UFS70772.1 hypothetical protein LPW11_00955 [Geomonas sp. RF6]
MPNFIPTLALQLLLLLPSLSMAGLTASLDPAQVDRSARVDIATVSGKFSYAEYLSASAINADKPAFPVHTVSPAAIPFGRYLLKKGTMYRRGDGPCGYILPLTSTGSINLLAYSTVTISGRFRGSWRLAFADLPLTAKEDNVPVALLTQGASQSFPLKSLVQKADLSRARQLVLLLDSTSGSAGVQGVRFTHEEGAPPAPAQAIWIWQRGKVVGHEEEVLQRLATRGIGKVYLQVGDDLEVFAPFLEKAARAGVDVFALDGSPDYLTAPQVLLSRIERVERYNESHPSAHFAGFQTDIEPYLNSDFNARRDFYATAYANLVAEIKERSRLTLSVVVPFWFDTLYAGDRSLIQQIAQNADEIVVMSYRTGREPLLQISASTLSLGEHLGKPVWLGVELGAIPDEEHVVLDRCTAGAPAAQKIGSSWWCEGRRYSVPGERISFRSRVETLPTFLRTAIPFNSFKGWVVHSYEELPL